MHPNYKMPKLYHQLKELDKKLQKEGYSLDNHFGLRLSEDFSHYHNTPLDLIPFGDIGMDGVHYGFLTDFGRVQNLEEAFIVLINPMDSGVQHKIVAANLREFLNLAWTMTGAVDLANVYYKKTEEDYIQLLTEFEESQDEIDDEYIEQQNYVLNRIRDEFSVQPIENIYEYIEIEVKAAREKQIVLSTLDGLGVVGEAGAHSKFEISEDEGVNVEQLNSFLATSSRESKLAFLRDVQFTNHHLDNMEIIQTIRNELKNLNSSYELQNYREIESI